jgi:hypothetical protein
MKGSPECDSMAPVALNLPVLLEQTEQALAAKPRLRVEAASLTGRELTVLQPIQGSCRSRNSSTAAES